MGKVSECTAGRIRMDADIALDSLKAILKECEGGFISARYLREKAVKAQRCCEFIVSVLDDESEEE